MLQVYQIRHDRDGQVYITHDDIITDAVWEKELQGAIPNRRYTDYRTSTKLAPDQEVEVLD